MVRTLDAGGTPLLAELRTDMERRLGHDFSQVRVHTDSTAADSAREIGARAYTVGHHIAFSSNCFEPATVSGRRLIAHELAHVVQQSSLGHRDGMTGALQRKSLNDPGSNDVVVAPQADRLASPADAGNGASADLPAVSPSPEGETEMPRLADRFADPVAPVRDSALGEGHFEAEEVDLGELFRALAFGMRESHKTVESYAWDARADIDRSAKAAIKQAGDHCKHADDAVGIQAAIRHRQVDGTVDAHEGQLTWQVRQCTERAGEYAANAKRAYTDGFDDTRGKLAAVFNVWGRRFEKLDTSEGKRIKETITANKSTALDYAGNYDIRAIRSVSQSAERAQVQRDAATELAMDFIDDANKVEPQIIGNLSEVTSALIRQVWKQRDDALDKYKEGLPPLLKGVDDQLALARSDIEKKGAQVGLKLTTIRAALHARVALLEHEANKSNAEFGSQVTAEIDRARSGAERAIQRATPNAIKPIGAVVSEAVDLLGSREDELDPAASRQFVGEVVQYSIDAAEGTGEIFAGARNKGVSSLASAGPLARQRFGKRVSAFQGTLHQEGVQNELEIISFSSDADAYLEATLKDLDGSYNDGMIRASKALTQVVIDTREALYEPLEKSRKDVIQSVNVALGTLSEAKSRLKKEIPKAARHAAWVYDHPWKDRIVRGADIFLGVLAAGLVIAALIFTLPFILGVEAAAVVMYLLLLVTSFLAGYYGAQSYDERRKAGQSGASAFLGAVADVTGLTDVRRSVTDQKMSDFDRGFAIGNFFLALFGAKEGVGRFYEAAKVRFPKLFTNPFRPRVPLVPLEPLVPAAGGVTADMPKPGLPDDLQIPHESVPGTAAPDTLPAMAPEDSRLNPPHEGIPGPDSSATLPDSSAKPPEPKSTPADQPTPAEDLLNPELSKRALEPQPDPGAERPRSEDRPAPDSSDETLVPKPGRVGFELPYEKQPAGKSPGATGTPDTGVDSSGCITARNR